MKLQSYKDFKVWQKSMDLAVEVYKLLKYLPKEETYGLANQMRRSVTSIPSNIAEWQGRNTTREFIQFLAVARGSQCEIETQLLLGIKLEYLEQKDAVNALGLCEEVGKMLNTLIMKLKSTFKG